MEVSWQPQKRHEPCDTAPTKKPSFAAIVTRTVPAPTRHGRTPEIRTTAAQSTVTTVTDTTLPVTQPRMGGQSNAKSSHPPRHETSKLEPTELKSDSDNHCTGHSSLSKQCHQRNVDKTSKQDQDTSVTTKPTPTHTQSKLAMSSSPSSTSTASSLMQKPLTTSHVRTELPHFKSRPKFDSPRDFTVPRQPNSRGSQSSWYSHSSRRTPQLPHSVQYKKKYNELLYFEEDAHKEILKSYDGEFTLELYQQKDKSTYACLCDLHDSKIAFVTQAAEVESREGVQISMKDNVRIKCAAHILRKNYIHTEQKLYIAFDKDNDRVFKECFIPLLDKRRRILVKVKFLLKSSYFRNLRKCVNNLPSEVIQRIQSLDHQLFSLETSENVCENYKQQLDTKQWTALNAILGKAPPNSPPILISGPFGTGKTRVMAIAAHKLFEKNCESARILVCTQQRESADNFMSMYREVVSLSGLDDTSVQKLILRFHDKRWPKKFYVHPEDLLHHLNAKVKKLLIVTTCLTAHYLQEVDLQFSHIFIDEGAQMREPEAVAALAFANHNTKIVIAGDPQQVGPATLVFGTEAKQGGLDKSLLERLISEYKEIEELQSCSKNYHITLVTNYRCHEDIRKLSSRLFYNDTPLKVPCETIKQPPSFGLHGSSSSLHFLCSSFSEELEAESDINEEEAAAVLDIVVEINRSRPKFLVSSNKLCIMSKPRSQLQTIYNMMSKIVAKELLQKVRRIPTFSMQGNEYCALVLSTSEHLNKDGSPASDSSKSLCNPYVFNTAITRAESLVVAVGNPFLLLKTEKHMLRDSNYKEKGKCWSNFLSHCIEHGTVTFSKSLKVSEEEKEVHLSKVKKILEERLEKAVKFISPAQRSHVTTLDDIYSPEYKLGDGGFGVVLKVKRLTDGYDLAIKLKLCVEDEKKTQDEAIKLRKLSTRHPINIVQYLDSGLARRPDWSEWQEWLTEKKSRMSVSSGTSIQGIDDSDLCFYILTEWCEEGTLEDWLRSNAAKKHRDRTTICNFLEQILQALKFIHEENLAHRDLKPSNIFFKSDGTLKVGDFGLVKDIDEECMAESSVPLPSEGDNLLSKHYGTNPYRSPELRNKRPRPEIDWKKTDIYALGVIFFELCWIIKSQLERDKILNRSNGLLPVDAKYKAQLPEGFREELCNEAAELVLLMTSFDPAKRPTAEEILEGALLSSMKKLYTMAPPPPEQPSMASMVQQSPSKQHPLRRSPLDIQLRPQQVGSQPAKQNSWSTQVRNSPNSPQPLQVQTRRVSHLTEQTRTVVHPRARALSAEETKTSGSQQTRPISFQQTRPPGAQQTCPPATQQTRPPGAQQTHQSGVPQTHPSGVQQTHPVAVRQTRPKSTSQLAASPIHNKHSSQPQLYAALAGKRSEARPSKLKWGDEEDSGLAPGAIESPAEFPPLGASTKGKKKKQRSGSQSKQKERQVPSNSLRDLSSKQTRRREEVKSLEDEDYNDDQVITDSNTEAILETTADPEVCVSTQQTRPPGAQQTRPPGAQQTHPSGVRQSSPIVDCQTSPKSTGQLAAFPVQKKKLRSASQSKQIERQVPSNSLRDLSSKQTRRREEVKILEDEDNNDDQVITDSNTEAILETTTDPEVCVSTQQTRPPGAQQTRPPGAQQTRPPGAQQTHPSGAQQTHPPGAQQTHPPGAQQTRPPGVRQSSPIVVCQTSPKSTGQLAAFPVQKKKQRSASQSKQIERQVPSNSLRDLSSKQTRRREEVKSLEDEDNNGF